MAKVAIVTDSTSNIPRELLNKYHISVAPQVVIFGEETLKDGVDIQPDDFYKRLATSPILPTTSQVAVPDFKAIFEKLHSEGYDILCMLISHKLSNTINAAHQAMELVPQAKIEIVDTLATSMAMGYQVVHVAKLAAQGATLEECKAVAEKLPSHSWVAVAPETLEFLHRGGRIGGATRFLATALNIRPVLELVHGRLEPLERVRTRKKMLARLVELAKEKIGDQKPVHFAVVHANSHEDADTVMKLVQENIHVDELWLTEVSPAVGAHTGPGTIGVAFFAGVE